MAEGVLFNVAEGILTTLGSQLILNEIGLLCGVKDELKKLKGTVSTIKAVLLDAEEKSVDSEAVREWLKQLKEAMYDAEDLVDDFSTEALRRKVMSGNKLSKEVRLFFSSSNQPVYALILAHKIKKLKGRLDHIANNKQFDLVERPLKSRVMPEYRKNAHSHPPNIVIGRDADEKAILEVLLSRNCKENVGTLSIVGIGGLGKTTLAQKVFHNKEVIGHFKMRAWVCVAENFDVKLIVEKILCFGSDEKLKDLSMDTLADRLHKKISGEKYLIVLDDVWEEDVERWRSLKNLLDGGLKGSRIIITTRLMTVAKMTCPIKVHELKVLSTKESWLLFTKIVLKEGQLLSESNKKIGEEIVAKCSGVPLALNVIGYLMHNQSSNWSSFLGKKILHQAGGSIMPILRLSYDYLPPHLKHCFAYCSIFPKDSVIVVSKLISLWMAQGYVRCLDYSQRLEDVGLGYFFDLVWGSFFQELKEDELGNVTTCKMHDLMHDLAVEVAGSEKSRHVSFCVDESNSSCQVQPSLHEAKDVRSFLLFHQYGCKIEEDQLCAIFSNVRLRILDLHKARISRLPQHISKLKYLRHIDLSWNRDLKMLPDSITELQNLQVLNLTCCFGLKELPKDIKKLVNLIQLDIYECDGLTHMPKGLGELTLLSMLPLFVLAKDGSSLKDAGALNELGSLNNLGGPLKIEKLPHGVNVVSECEAAKLREKQHLQILELQWQDGDQSLKWWQPDYQKQDFQSLWRQHRDRYSNEVRNNELALKALQPHPNLKELSVRYYKGSQFPGWLSSLNDLVKIKIENCSNCRHLPPLLHRLRSLVTLQIWSCNSLEYIEDNGDSSKKAIGGSFFPSLKTLNLDGCHQLKGWWKITPTTQLPRFNLLSELTIISCPEITAMPLFPPLRRLRFDGANIKSLERILNIIAPSASSTASLSSSSSSSSSRCLALSQLEYFYISGIRDLKSLPEWMQHISTLQELIIIGCYQLETLPKWMRQLNSLQKLEIGGCPKLSYRLSNNGEDWKHIDHIPNISVDGRKVQRSNHKEHDAYASPSVSSECASMQLKGKKIMEDAIESEEDMEDAIESEEDMEDATESEEDMEDAIEREEDMEDATESEEDMEDAIEREEDMEDAIEREEDMEDAIEREEEKIMCLGMFTCLSGWLSRIFQLEWIRKTKSERNISF